MITHADISQLFDTYRSLYPDEGENFPVLCEQLKNFETDICSRKNFRGHIVTDGCVIDPKEKKILLIHHGLYNFWTNPGGHIEESDEHPADAARREVLEETGVSVGAVFDEWQEPLLLHIDSHVIPANEKKSEPEHWHHDMTFLFLADSTIPLPDITDSGVTSVRWVSFEEALQIERIATIIHKIELF